jgi:hypothetical protein
MEDQNMEIRIYKNENDKFYVEIPIEKKPIVLGEFVLLFMFAGKDHLKSKFGETRPEIKVDVEFDLSKKTHAEANKAIDAINKELDKLYN